MISVITPAHNEAGHIEKCLRSVKAATQGLPVAVEHVVVLNRCQDNTEAIAVDHGARVLRDDTKNLSHIRNTGANAAAGNILVTIDADSQMSVNMLEEVLRKLQSGRWVGGGVTILPERISIGILCSLMVVAPFVLRHGVSAGMFWCRRKDFEAIGGFDETLPCLEDIDFAKRLKRHGRTSGKRYGTIWKAHIVTSCRKFDQFGDWHFVRHPGIVYRLFHHDPQEADQYYYFARSRDNTSPGTSTHENLPKK